ncbi:hypothetical protein Tco_0296490 [Tanacetum coccineum]
MGATGQLCRRTKGLGLAGSQPRVRFGLIERHGVRRVCGNTTPGALGLWQPRAAFGLTLAPRHPKWYSAALSYFLGCYKKLARKQEEEANIALIESWENTQAMMEADRLLAERLQSKEREELTDEEKAKLFMELMEKRRKHFAALRAQEKRNRPPTKAQKRTQMSTYLKHMGGYTYKQLKGKSFDEIQKLFDKEMKRVNTFVAMGSEVQESKEKKEEGREETTKGSRKKMLGRKRAGKEQQQESSKKQKVEEEKESDTVDEYDEAELKKLLVIKKDEDIAIDAIPLATKLPVIIDYKLHKEGMMVHYQLIRADGSSKRYSSMIRMLQGIDREDLEALWRIVKAKYGDTRPDNEFERVLWGDLKVMFEPDKRSDVWRILQGYRRNLKIQKMNIKFRGGLLGLKRLHGFLEVTAAQSSVENLVPIPSESEDFSDIESECDVPVCDNFTTFSNPLFDADDDFSSSDDESFSDEDVPKEIYSNPLFDEEIISTKIDPHHFNAESDLIESLLNRDTLIISSPKFDSLLEEFSGELAHIDLIPPGINEADFDPEEEIRLVEKLLYDNSSPRPPEEFNSENYDIEYFSPFPIHVEDSDSLMEEVDLFLTLDDSMPPGIESDDYDSEGDILFLEELLSNDSPSLPENESFHFDVPSSPRPPAKPPDDGIYFDPDTGVFTKVVDDISDNSTRELYVHVPNVLPTQPTLCPVIDTLIPFLFENENKVFNSGILASNEEKCPHLLSHQGFKAFQIISESPMMIYRGDSPILDVPFLHFYPH